MRPRVTLPGGAQFVHHPHDLVDGDGQGNAHEAAAARNDLRVDADDLALQVEQRAARVAGVHRARRSG